MTIVGKTLHARAASLSPANGPGAVPGQLELTTPAARQALAAALSALPRGSTVSYEPRAVFSDELGQTHVRLDRKQRGLPIFGEQVIAHLDRVGACIGVTGGRPAREAAGASAPPRLSPAQAIEATTRDLSTGVPPTQKLTTKLGWFEGDDGQLHKAYQVAVPNQQLATGPVAMRYFIDAHSGETLAAYDEAHSYFSGPQGEKLQQALAAEPDAFAQNATAIAPGTGASLYSGVVPLQTHRNEDGTYSLQDDARGGGTTKDDLDGWTNKDASDFRDSNNVWGEATDSPRQRAAIDAHYAMAMTWDFLKNVLGRNSIDDKGMPLNSFVHYAESNDETEDRNDSEPYNNANWNGKEMIYGDGNGIRYSPLVCLDIAGHEISHGLNHETANLQPIRESGGLAEAMSDIFGIGVRWYASQQNPNVKFSWRHGEQVFTPNIPDDAERYMDDPTRDHYSIDHYSNAGPLVRNRKKDNGGVHATSGIANNAFYLMVDGGTNRTSGLRVDHGMGMETALKIMYRALTTYFQPYTGFREAAEGVVRAAIDLHGEGSPEVETVRQAWRAVGTLD